MGGGGGGGGGLPGHFLMFTQIGRKQCGHFKAFLYFLIALLFSMLAAYGYP